MFLYPCLIFKDLFAMRNYIFFTIETAFIFVFYLNKKKVNGNPYELFAI